MKRMHKFAPSRGTNLNTHTPCSFSPFPQSPFPYSWIDTRTCIYFLKQEDYLNRILLHAAEWGASKHWNFSGWQLQLVVKNIEDIFVCNTNTILLYIELLLGTSISRLITMWFFLQLHINSVGQCLTFFSIQQVNF